MQTKSVSTDSFIALEREMQNRFAELATMFDFNEAERKAIDSLNNVYKLADKARGLLEEDFNFAPKHAVVSAEEFNQQRQQFGGSAGSDAGAVQAHPAVAAGRLQRGGLGLTRIEPADRADHVLAGSQQRGNLLDVGQQRRVDDGVGVGVEDLLDAVGGPHPDRPAADDVADVAAGLVRRAHPAADQFEVGVLEHRPDRRHSDRTGGPLHHPKCHRRQTSRVAN